MSNGYPEGPPCMCFSCETIATLRAQVEAAKAWLWAETEFHARGGINEEIGEMSIERREAFRKLLEEKP